MAEDTKKIEERVIEIVCEQMGASRDKIDAGLHLDKKIKFVKTEDLHQAFRRATASARPGDIILLSPMCASLDQYKSFEERGVHFKELVREFSNTITLPR